MLLQNAIQLDYYILFVIINNYVFFVLKASKIPNCATVLLKCALFAVKYIGKLYKLILLFAFHSFYSQKWISLDFFIMTAVQLNECIKYNILFHFYHWLTLMSNNSLNNILLPY